MTADLEHHWQEVTFIYERRIQCSCGYMPNSQADMDAHIPGEEMDLETLKKMDNISEGFAMIITGLTNQFGRLPTEEEVLKFVSGTPDERMELWNNKGIHTNDDEDQDR